MVHGLLQSLVAAALTAEETTDAQGSRLWVVNASLESSTELIELAVTRNLTCSSALADNKNQSIHTRCNCLVSRMRNGEAARPGRLTINGALAPPLPPHAPSKFKGHE